MFLTISLSLFLTNQAFAEDTTRKVLDDKIQEDLKLAEAAKERLTGGVVQIQEDKRIENLMSSSGNFKKCQDDFKVLPQASKDNPDLLPQTCFDIIKVKNGKIDKNDLEDLGKKLNISFFSPSGVPIDRNKNYSLLKKYLEDRLQKTLYGENVPKGTVSTVDHAVYYDLYKTQVSKNFLFDMSSYCSETYKDGSSASDYTATNETTLQNDTIADIAKDPKVMASKFQECILTLPCQCYDDTKACSIKSKDPATGAITTKTHKAKAANKGKACVLVGRLKQMKQILLNVEDTQEKMRENFKNPNLIHANAKNYDSTEQDKTLDDLTTLSSGDYAKAVGDLKTATKDFQQKTKCDNAKLATGADFKAGEGECAGLASIDKDKIEELKLENQLQTKAMLAQLDNVKSQAELEEYIKGQKLGDTIKQEIAKDWETVRDELKARLKTERQAVIDEINNELNKNVVITSTTGGKSTVDSSTNATEVLKRVENQDQRTERLLHYTNIVSGYLDVLKDGKKTYNTKSLGREVSGLSDDLKKADNNTYFNKLSNSQNVQDQIKKGATDTSGTMFDINTIDKILSSGDAD